MTKLAAIRITFATLLIAGLGAALGLDLWTKTESVTQNNVKYDVKMTWTVFKTKTCVTALDRETCETDKNGFIPFDNTKAFWDRAACEPKTKKMFQAQMGCLFGGCVVGLACLILSFITCGGFPKISSLVSALFVLATSLSLCAMGITVSLFMSSNCTDKDAETDWALKRFCNYNFKDDGYKIGPAAFAALGSAVVGILEIIASCLIRERKSRVAQLDDNMHLNRV